MFDRLRQRLRFYRSYLPELLSGRIFDDLHDRLFRLEKEQLRRATREELDLLKSHLELDRELFDAYRRWRDETPVPDAPLVSVCVPTYNRAALLTERCLPSILGQTYERLEVIVVGDACTDDTAERVRALDDDRVRFINLERRGRYPEEAERRWLVAGAAPTNEALRLATGDYITHLDDDDAYVPRRIETLVDFAAEHDCDFVWHPFWWEDGPGNWVVNQAEEFALGQVTMSSVLYRGWLKRIESNVNAHLLHEPADWNRFRRIKYLVPVARRCPEPLLRHHIEQQQMRTGAVTGSEPGAEGGATPAAGGDASSP